MTDFKGFVREHRFCLVSSHYDACMPTILKFGLLNSVSLVKLRLLSV